MNRLSSIILFISVCLYGQAQKAVIPQAVPGINFAENNGQWESNVLYRAGLDGGALFLEQNKLTFNFYDKRKYRQHHTMSLKEVSKIDDQIKGHGFSVEFENCNVNCVVEKQQKGSYYENYFIGNNKNKWKGNVSHYHQLVYKNLYNNIDYEIITAINNVKYNFHVKPGGNTSAFFQL